ncbi:sugar ABC transporter permease [Sphingomonas sp.]|uniref:carbohydrate ABC transporter permease n=1 Tax=Sphingomonas sp. TaxID=28214 RepID=UPI00286DB4E1|nr:sugar ABC transporter permease [Sphingomonas sp.]
MSPARRRDYQGLAFVAPFLLLYLFLLIYPLLRGIVTSFQRADPFGGGRFIGFDNYTQLAADPVFHQSLLNTFAFAAMVVIPLTLLTLLLALALNKPTRGAAWYRGLFFAPSVLSVTIVTLIWRFVLAPDAGLVGEVMQATGGAPIPFLSDPALVKPAIALTTIWWSFGLPMMLFLAGLQQIPEDVYEAAALDNASKWATFWRVTLPSLRRTVLLVVMLQTAAQLQLFGQAQLLTSGGPNGASRPVVLFIFESAFVRWQLGYASAAAEILFMLILLVTLVQYWTVTRRQDA